MKHSRFLNRALSLLPLVSILAISARASAQTSDDDLPPLPAPPRAAWYEQVELRGFLDGYASLNYNFPKPSAGANAGRFFDTDNGFGLAWVGLDASYGAEPVGGTISLRLGPAAEIYSAGEPESLRPIKQAFASWRPGGPSASFQLDFGKFDSFYGVEVADSQDNYTYTRGLLYHYGAPHFHTGLRATWQASRRIELKLLAANGWNNSVDSNTGKSFGAQANVALTDRFKLSFGWLGGPEQPDSVRVACAEGTAYDEGAGSCTSAPGVAAAEYGVDRGGANEFEAWRHLLDFVLRWEPSDAFGLALNADYGWEGIRQTAENSDTDKLSWFGAALAGRYALNETWAIALRGEYFRAFGENDEQGASRISTEYFPLATPDLSLASGTLTLELKPSDHLIIRLENRGDFALSAHENASKDVFAKELRDSASRQITTTLGVVVTTH